MSDFDFSSLNVRSTARILFAGLVVLLISSFIYSPGMSGGFAFDDYPNILQNAAIMNGDTSLASLAQVAWSGNAGPFKRPIAMLSFAFNYYATGMRPFGFKLTNLAIHLVNGVLVLWIAGLILRARASIVGVSSSLPIWTCALAVSAIWLVHPINLTSVLYVVQRMNSLASTFTLIAIICYCVGRFRLMAGQAYGNLQLYLGFSTFTVLGTLCKENALLALPLVGAIEICFFRLRTAERRDRKLLLVYLGVALLIPCIFAVTYLIVHPEWLASSYDGRPFTLIERCLTESRVLWFYVSMLFMPKIGSMSLFHDDYILSTGVLDPISTIFAIVGIVVSLFVALASIRRFPVVAFAISWFMIGHAMESTLFPLELIHEHRNYLPSIGLIFGATVGTLEFARITNVYWMPPVLAVASFFVLSILTFLRAGDWSDPITLASTEADRNPQSYRANYELGRVRYGRYLMNQDEKDYHASIAIIERSANMNPAAKRPLVELIRVTNAHGDESKLEWADELIRRYRETQFHNSEWMDLHKLVRCHLAGDCTFPAATLVDVYAAALSNPGVSQHVRAQLMADLAVLYAHKFNDYGPASALLDDAVKIRPNEFRFRAARIEVMVLSGRFEEAKTAIRMLNDASVWDDFFVTPATRVAELKRLLNEARALSGN